MLKFHAPAYRKSFQCQTKLSHNKYSSLKLTSVANVRISLEISKAKNIRKYKKKNPRRFVNKTRAL